MKIKNETVTENEEIILELLEQESPLTMQQIIKLAKVQKDWSDSTIKTFVRRLVQKGAVTVKEDKVQYFMPSCSREQRAQSAIHEIIQKFYDGQWRKAVLSFAEEEKITKEDLEEALRIIEENE